MIDQKTADKFLATQKTPLTKETYNWNQLDRKPISIPLEAKEFRGEAFALDISRKKIVLKMKYQLRARQTIVLARLDFGAPHRNPDGKEIGVPHLHLYREGYGDKFAYPVPPGMLRNPNDPKTCLEDFMARYNIQALLFSYSESVNDDLFS